MAYLIPQHHKTKAVVKKGKKWWLKCLSSTEKIVIESAYLLASS